MRLLLERDRELGAIRDGLDEAAAGDGVCLFVEGPAGIGKSALLQEAREQAGSDGFRVLSGTGGELETEFPYGVARQLFEPLLTNGPSADELLTGAAALARPVFALSPTGGSKTGDSYGLEALHGLYWLTVNLAAAEPMLVAVDDVHWCDGASLRFLLYLARRLEGLPVMLLLAARPGEAKDEERLVDEFGSAMWAAHLRPAALSPEAVRAVLQTGLASEPEPAFTAAAHASTAGNPFLLRELVGALAARGTSPTADAAEEVSEIGPQGVRQAVLRRLARLGDGAIVLARAVAVLGGGTTLHDAAALAELDDATAADVVGGLVRIQILRDERRLSFVHPLVRAAIYSDIPASVRAQAHGRAAEILERGGAEPDAVAAHLLESDPRGSSTVVEHLRAVARRAAEQGAMDVAATYLRRALAEPPADDQRAALLWELGAAELAAGQPDAAAERLTEAASQADGLEAQITIGLMRRHALVVADRIGEAVAALDEVRPLTDDPDLIDLLEGGALGAGQIDFLVVRGLDDRLTNLRARAGDPSTSEPLLLAVAAVAAAFGNAPASDVVALADRALAELPNAHPASDYTVEGQLGLALYLAERFDRARDFVSERLEDARRQGSLPRFISMAFVRSNIEYLTGALQDALADAHDSLEATRLYGHQFWLPAAVAAVVNPLTELGQVDEAERILVDTRVEERHGASSSFSWATMLLPARARLRLAQDRHRDGLADLLLCGERYESASNRSPALWPWRSGAALALFALGDEERAQRLAVDEVRLARDFGAPRALGVALRAAGIVERAPARLEEAAAVLAGSGAVLEHARALVDLGSAVRRASRRAEARATLREGLDLATRCGARVLEDRARAELRASGAHRRSDRLTGPEALTPSELRVARMAANGLSNPEIAQALFLTRRTVETHLTHAYQKLDITSREELAAVLA